MLLPTRDHFTLSPDMFGVFTIIVDPFRFLMETFIVEYEKSN